MNTTPEAEVQWSIAADGVQDACFALRASQYGRYYSNIPDGRFADEFDTALLPDDRPGAEVVAATVGGTVVGTIRLVLSVHPSFPGLRSEAAEFMSFDWAEVARLAGVPAGGLVAGEVGKFAVAACQDRQAVKWAVVSGAGHLAARRGMHVILALMTPLVERSVRQVGFNWRRVQGARLR